MRTLGIGLLLATGLAALPAPARACGCFAPPDPANPVVQAGERILFSAANGQITAIIQIQFQGSASDFGWLLPLPSVPTLDVSSDDVFVALAQGTTPYYNVLQTVDPNCYRHASPDAAAAFAADMGVANGGGPPDPLVIQDSVGPYDYAVLKADDKSAMVNWLNANHYLIPTGTDGVLGNYIHPGAYFLALKLKPGSSVGDLQPVVVHYASDLPMIPITLTSVTASPDMAIWAWVLGSARAVPRNYYHTVLDDAALDWTSLINGLPDNYEAVVSAAVKEAPGHHTFITELAQQTFRIKEQTFPSTRFGDLAVLRMTPAALDYLNYLRFNGYSFSQTLVNILSKYIKKPDHVAQFGPEPSLANYYYNFATWYLQNPAAFQNFDLTFDPVALTNEIEAKIVKPVRDAAALFDSQPYLTRLHTRLDPLDMNSDPVFSFNPDLPVVSTLHTANETVTCSNDGTITDVLITEQGWYDHPYRNPDGLPNSLIIEALGESGSGTIKVDNHSAIHALLGDPPAANNGSNTQSSCALGGRGNPGVPASLIALAGLGLFVRRRRNSA